METCINETEYVSLISSHLHEHSTSHPALFNLSFPCIALFVTLSPQAPSPRTPHHHVQPSSNTIFPAAILPMAQKPPMAQRPSLHPQPQTHDFTRLRHPPDHREAGRRPFTPPCRNVYTHPPVNSMPNHRSQQPIRSILSVRNGVREITDRMQNMNLNEGRSRVGNRQHFSHASSHVYRTIPAINLPDCRQNIFYQYQRNLQQRGGSSEKDVEGNYEDYDLSDENT